MRIGILTYHWATNYGAVLQAYALQKKIEEAGHIAEFIDYKPKLFDFSPIKLIRHPRLLLWLRRTIRANKKECKLEVFRKQYLNRTNRLFTYKEVNELAGNYDILISGSDQILSPDFTLRAEKGGTSVYFLNFDETNALKVGYAVSFGCTIYTEKAAHKVEKFINSFDIISVRENTGIDVLKQIGYKGNAEVIPDPTILAGISLFDNIKIESNHKRGNYNCVYMLRWNLKERIENAVHIEKKVFSMQEWLALIKYSRMVITNSYHGMIMALLFHVPFIVVLEKGKDKGMNDRFYTLLSKLDLTHRIADGSIKGLMNDTNICWEEVDRKMNDFRMTGINFLNGIFATNG